MLGNMEHAPKLGEYLEAQLERWVTISRTTGMQVNSTFLLGAAICGLAQKPDSVVLGGCWWTGLCPAYQVGWTSADLDSAIASTPASRQRLRRMLWMWSVYRPGLSCQAVELKMRSPAFAIVGSVLLALVGPW